MTANITRNFVEKLQKVRDEYEAERGPDAGLDNLVKENLTKLLMESKDAATTKWCIRELEKENVSHRLRKAESLVPSGILEDENEVDTIVFTPKSKMVSSQLYPWNPEVDVPESMKWGHENPFNRDAPEFVPYSQMKLRTRTRSRSRSKRTKQNNPKGGRKHKKSIRRGKH